MENLLQIIIKKRDGEELTEREVESIVNGYVSGDLPDYQMTVFLMAVYFQGMTDIEIGYLTNSYIRTGDRIDFPFTTVDKHSTGGVGDKISIMLAPIVAACGVKVPMISGRALGHTGGTLDKLESIPGLRTDLSESEFRKVIDEVGFSIISQTDNLVPADRKIYALRDVTGTVESLPLITASIMSKKIAEGAANLVLDLKVGTGAFMQNESAATKLGKMLKSTGERLGQRVEIVYSNMNSPLGLYIGNALEVQEAIEYLQGKNIPDLDMLTKHLAAKMLTLSGTYQEYQQAMRAVTKAIESGQALERLARFIRMQGGDDKVCETPQILGKAKYTVDISANKTGYIQSIDTRRIGYALMNVNAGRRVLESQLDYNSGAYIEAKIGDFVNVDEAMGKVICNDKDKGRYTAELITKAYIISDHKKKKENIILEVE